MEIKPEEWEFGDHTTCPECGTDCRMLWEEQNKKVVVSTSPETTPSDEPSYGLDKESAAVINSILEAKGQEIREPETTPCETPQLAKADGCVCVDHVNPNCPHYDGTSDERERFEAWYKSEHSVAPFKRKDGRYGQISQPMWEAWQAALRSSGMAAPPYEDQWFKCVRDVRYFFREFSHLPDATFNEELRKTIWAHLKPQTSGMAKEPTNADIPESKRTATAETLHVHDPNDPFCAVHPDLAGKRKLDLRLVHEDEGGPQLRPIKQATAGGAESLSLKTVEDFKQAVINGGTDKFAAERIVKILLKCVARAESPSIAKCQHWSLMVTGFHKGICTECGHEVTIADDMRAKPEEK